MKQASGATTPTLTQILTGWILVGMLALALIAALTQKIPTYIAGIPVWIAAIMMTDSLKKKQLIQNGILFSVGCIGLIVGALNEVGPEHFLKATEANLLLIAMIVSVSFLRIVTTQNIRGDEQLPIGKKAMMATLFGSHLISAAINMSSVIIMGDRLNDKKPLTAIQALSLLRAFSICALWSPFFAAMGVILISVPGAELGTLILFGLPATLAALLMTVWQISNYSDIENTPGYPMHFRALWMPLFLAILVMIELNLWPDLPAITLITLTSILFVLAYLPIKCRKRSIHFFNLHVQEGLPKLGGEVTLFLAAAVMAAGVAALLESFGIRLAPEHFTAFEANLTLVAVVGLTMIGMPPVTTAILAGSILMPSVSDPNLLGIALLLGWSIGVGVSPFSAVQLSVQSRFCISALDLIKLNLLYTPVMLSIGFFVIWGYARLTGMS